MASITFMIAIINFFFAVCTPAMAEEIAVGDENGWKLNFDYKTWSAGKEFYAGDTLVFNYKQGVHNVVKVNQTQYQNCDLSGTAEPLTAGNDKITLATPGKKWYICGVGDHCSKGMKLAINVLEQTDAPASAPGGLATPGSNSGASVKFMPWMVAASMSFLLMIMA